MKNNVVVVLLVVLIGLLAGGALLQGINNSVQTASLPMRDKINELVTQQKIAERKFNEMQTKLNDMDNKLTELLKRPVSAPPQGQQQPQPPQEDLNKVHDIPVGDSQIIGNKDAPITIVKFTDLQCPYCVRFFPAVKETLKSYPDQVRLIVKNFPLPFHPNARPAAKMTLAAKDQGKYYEMLELLLESAGDVSEPKVQEYAKKIGLNYKKLMADLKVNDAKYEQLIAADMQLAQKVEVRGTPTYFINGKKTMARDAAGFKAEVEKILGSK